MVHRPSHARAELVIVMFMSVDVTQSHKIVGIANKTDWNSPFSGHVEWIIYLIYYTQAYSRFFQHRIQCGD